MPTDKTPWASASVNRKLLKMLDDWTEHNSENKLPFPTSSDVLNSLMLHFLIEVTGDRELVQLAKRLEPLDRNIHSAVENFFKTRPKRD